MIKIGSDEDDVYAMAGKVIAASLQTLLHKAILQNDEYDIPLDKAFQVGYYDEMVILIRNLLGNVLKINDSLYFVALTGCLRISRKSIVTRLNNLKVHTISDAKYDEFFAFANGDEDEMLADPKAMPKNTAPTPAAMT